MSNLNEKIAEGVTEGLNKIEDGVVSGYKKIEDGVVSGYKKIEEGAVEGFNKVTDKFVDKFFTKEGETVEEAKKRMQDTQKAAAQKGAAEHKTVNPHVTANNIVEESMKKTQEAAANARKMAGLE